MGDLHAYDISVFSVNHFGPADPAAGAGIAIPIDHGRVEILSVSFRLTTSAVAGNRYAGCQFNYAGANPIWTSYSPLAQTASITHDYCFQRGIAPFFNVLDPSGYTTVGFGTNLIIGELANLDIIIYLIGLADQISNIHLYCARWPSPHFPPH